MSKNYTYNYSQLKNTGCLSQENFLVKYAVSGQLVDPAMGVRAGMPIDYPLCNSPVKEPSPLNTRWMYNQPTPNSGIF